MTEENKKILMIGATPFFSDRGCHIRIYNEIKYLKKEGYDVTLCTYHIGNEIDGIKTIRSLSIPWYKKVTPGASWHKLYLDVLLTFTTLKIYLKERPDIIHAHLYEGLLIGYVIKLITFSKSKFVFDCQGSLAEEMWQYTLHNKKGGKFFYKIFKWIEKVLLKLPGVIFCSSQNSYNFIKENYPMAKNKLHILEDAIDMELFKKTDDEFSREEFGINESDIVIVYSGSLTKAKGVDDLIDALPEVFDTRADIKFLIVGYGDLEKGMRSELKKYLQNGQLIMTGRLSYFDLPKYLRLADYAIDPKKDSSESSGKLYNYIAAGLPVICFESDFVKGELGDKGRYIDSLIEVKDIYKMGDINSGQQSSNIKTWHDSIRAYCEIV